MTTPTQTLTDFLLARLAEDEAVAQHATTGPWRYDPMVVNSVDREESIFAGPVGASAICVASTGPESGQSMIDARHIATHDPARVLAEVEAKRRIVESLEHDHRWAEGPLLEQAHAVLTLLALPYADHPDYREEWRA